MGGQVVGRGLNCYSPTHVAPMVPHPAVPASRPPFCECTAFTCAPKRPLPNPAGQRRQLQPDAQRRGVQPVHAGQRVPHHPHRSQAPAGGWALWRDVNRVKGSSTEFHGCPSSGLSGVQRAWENAHRNMPGQLILQSAAAAGSAQQALHPSHHCKLPLYLLSLPAGVRLQLPQPGQRAHHQRAHGDGAPDCAGEEGSGVLSGESAGHDRSCR